MALELYNRVIEGLTTRRENVLNGGINCIPFNLPRFEEELPGVEKKQMYGVTASTKVGKTQITDSLFVYNPVLYAFNHPEQIRLKIFYFTLEMSKEQKYTQLMSHLLYTFSQSNIRISPKDLRSTKASTPLSQEILDILESDEYKAYFDFFESHVEFIDNIRNPFGIYKFCREYALTHGTQHKKVVSFVDKTTGEVTDQEIDDWYEPHDPDEYVIIILDHISLISPENNMSLKDSMSTLTSKYFVQLRNKYSYSPVVIQQQAASQESNENFKLNKLRPTTDGLGDSKVCARDYDILIGLFSPFRHAIPTYEGYDVTKWRDNIRFLEIIVGREGGGGTLCPLFFDGAVNFFTELPRPEDTEGMRRAEVLLKRAHNKEHKLGVVLMAFQPVKKRFKLLKTFFNGENFNCIRAKWLR